MIYNLEMAVIKCLWMDDNWDVVKLNELQEEWFEHCKDIFIKVREYRQSGKVFDILLTSQSIGAEYTSELIRVDVALTSYPFYLKELKQKYRDRCLWRQLEAGEINEDTLKQALRMTSNDTFKSTIYDLEGHLATEFVEAYDKRSRGEIPRIKTNIDFIDDKWGNLDPSFIVIGARHGTGKTNFALKLFYKYIMQQIPSLFISTETRYWKLIARIVAQNSNLNAFSISNGTLNAEEITIMNNVVSELYQKPGKIEDVSGYDINLLKKRIEEFKPKVVIIDFLQMAKLQYNKNDNRVVAHDELAKQIKMLSTDTDTIIIGLSQLSKEGWTKECVSYEEKADIVCKMMEDDKKAESWDSKYINFTISKNREGRTGTIPLVFKKHNCSFGVVQGDENEVGK